MKNFTLEKLCHQLLVRIPIFANLEKCMVLHNFKGLYSNKDGEVNCPIEFTMDSARGRMEQLVEDFKRLKPLEHRNLLVLDETVQYVTKMVRILSQSSQHNMILIGEGIIILNCLVFNLINILDRSWMRA